jgi:signal transduction histidine kinase
LFRRIFATFVLTVVVSAAVSSVGAYMVATGEDSEWVDQAMDVLESHEDDLRAAAGDRDALEAALAAVSRELKTDVAVYGRGRAGGKIAGSGPDLPPPALFTSRRDLRRGRPIAFRDGPLRNSGLALAVPRHDGGGERRNFWILVVHPPPGKRLAIPLLTLTLVIAVLGTGAGVLSRSISRRLQRLGGSAARIASGDLHHRAAVRAHGRPDEIDHLGEDFNEMAMRVEGLLQGQRTLLANVSHELRTPIARMRVLLEILQERVENLRAIQPEPSRDVTRLDKGLTEMQQDVVEIEALISDLLTSGRLELGRGAGVPMQRGVVPLGPMLDKVARRVDATVQLSDPGLEADLDELLIERLLSNLLANGRRACPDGEIVVAAQPRPGGLQITVTDEGAGVPVEHREAIFEPFRRLDAARDRDRGGVGLGLYLSRQICAAHGGTIEVTDRPDGRSGAHFVIWLPAEAPAEAPAPAA